MKLPRELALAALAAGATLVSGHAAAQADNTNSLTSPDRLWTALSERTSETGEVRSPLDEALRRPGGERHVEGLSATELGLLYGSFEPRGDVDPSPP